ncbi:hypothetical protein J4425_00470 [Candidatus Woesearchaeota archaeon]|nr:hypothetical protein [uncultured archaeon]AQS33986.1 hypothetical protein [uncultured archaeon]MBS3150269.1 hypothetical protein [Candidatus Woesearchaeota archaeon]
MPDILSLRNDILNYVAKNGPVLPVQISKQINNNIIFAGAVLSELVASKKVKISNSKIGGSPVYYISGQEYKLSMLYPYLKDVHKKVYDLLKEKKVLQDISVEPWQRVALREIPDFANMLRTRDNQIFWKWYLVSEDEAVLIIKEILGINEIKESAPEPKSEVKEEPMKEIIAEPEVKPEVKEEKPKQKKLVKPKRESVSLSDFFRFKSVEIIDEKIVKKGKELNYIGEISSDLGLMKVFIKYIDKKRISDADLISAHNEAQLKKLALYFISHGDLTKKARDYTRNNFLIYEKLK